MALVGKKNPELLKHSVQEPGENRRASALEFRGAPQSGTCLVCSELGLHLLADPDGVSTVRSHFSHHLGD